jgi:hypothetical protein
MLDSREKDRHPTAVAPQPGAEERGPPEPVTSDDIPALRAIVEGIAQSTGEEFFQNLVRHPPPDVNSGQLRHCTPSGRYLLRVKDFAQGEADGASPGSI